MSVLLFNEPFTVNVNVIPLFHHLLCLLCSFHSPQVGIDCVLQFGSFVAMVKRIQRIKTETEFGLVWREEKKLIYQISLKEQSIFFSFFFFQLSGICSVFENMRLIVLYKMYTTCLLRTPCTSALKKSLYQVRRFLTFICGGVKATLILYFILYFIILKNIYFLSYSVAVVIDMVTMLSFICIDDL